MEEAPENGKESSYSAHDNGMNELGNYQSLVNSTWTVVCRFVNSTCDCVQVPVRGAVTVYYMLCVHIRFLISITVFVCVLGCGGKETTVHLLLFCHQKHSINNTEFFVLSNVSPTCQKKKSSK